MVLDFTIAQSCSLKFPMAIPSLSRVLLALIICPDHETDRKFPVIKDEISTRGGGGTQN